MSFVPLSKHRMVLFIFISAQKKKRPFFLYFILFYKENWAVIWFELDHLLRRSSHLGWCFQFKLTETSGTFSVFGDKHQLKIFTEASWNIVSLREVFLLSECSLGSSVWYLVSILRGLGKTPDLSIPLHPQFFGSSQADPCCQTAVSWDSVLQAN